jgi:hypothetical protein
MTEALAALSAGDVFFSPGATVAVAPPELFRVNSPMCLCLALSGQISALESQISYLKSQI